MNNHKVLVPPAIKPSQTSLFSTLTGPGTEVSVSEGIGVANQSEVPSLTRGQEYATAVFSEITNEFTLNDLIEFKTEFTRLLNANVKNLWS